MKWCEREREWKQWSCKATQFRHCRRMCITLRSRFGKWLTHPMHHRALFSTHAHVLLWYHFTNTWQRVTKPWSFEIDQIIVSHWNGIRTKNFEAEKKRDEFTKPRFLQMRKLCVCSFNCNVNRICFVTFSPETFCTFSTWQICGLEYFWSQH